MTTLEFNRKEKAIQRLPFIFLIKRLCGFGVVTFESFQQVQQEVQASEYQ